jgi:hypothetical protein
VDPRTLMILAAAVAAVLAVVAVALRLSGRVPDRAVDALYRVSYAFTALSGALFIMQGLFGGR